MSALDLIEVGPRRGLKIAARSARPDGSSVLRITLDSPPPRGAFAARGLSILQLSLADSKGIDLRSFDLLYSDAGRLIAVFPVLPKTLLDETPQTREIWERIVPRYFDLSPYQLAIPRLDDQRGVEKWAAFAAGFKRDQAAIAAFIAEHFDRMTAVYPDFQKEEFPYRLHEIDVSTGKWDVHGFSPLVFDAARSSDAFVCDEEPDAFLRRLQEPRSKKRLAIIPNFPTVYALGTLSPDELEYLRQAYTKFDLGPTSKILVVGPGTGVDAWIASLRTQQPVTVIGINPLEVANTKATAKISGFKLRALVGDNIADEAGNPWFPDERFDAVFWNMPAYWPKPQEEHRTPLAQSWDGDVGGAILKRLAKNLPKILVRDGHVLLWNFASYEKGPDGVNEVAEILKLAGTPTPVFDVQDHSFPKRAGNKKEWYKGHLYILSHVRAH